MSSLSLYQRAACVTLGLYLYTRGRRACPPRNEIAEPTANEHERPDLADAHAVILTHQCRSSIRQRA